MSFADYCEEVFLVNFESNDKHLHEVIDVHLRPQFARDRAHPRSHHLGTTSLRR